MSQPQLEPSANDLEDDMGPSQNAFNIVEAPLGSQKLRRGVSIPKFEDSDDDDDSESEEEDSGLGPLNSMLSYGEISVDSGYCDEETAGKEEHYGRQISSTKLNRLEVSYIESLVSHDERVGPGFRRTDDNRKTLGSTEPKVFPTTSDDTQSLSGRIQENLSPYPEPLDSPRDEFLEMVFQESGGFMSSFPTTSTASQANSTNESSSVTPPSSLTSSMLNSGGTVSSTKRRRGSDEEGEEENGRDRPRKHRRLDPSDRSERGNHLGQRLACHFHLFDQHRYCKNSLNGKKYETCSGPGWLSMHYLKQHLGNAASSVHKKIRCPRCLKPFKTAAAVLKHQDADPPECLSQSTLSQDDIDKAIWGKIDQDISRQGFERLPQTIRDAIDLWVVESLDDFTPNESVEPRKWELRKWNMTWGILFPDCAVPPSPFYAENMLLSLTNIELLVKSYRETVESGIQLGELEGIDDETLDKLSGFLRTAIFKASSSWRSQLLLHPSRRNSLFPNLETEVPEPPPMSQARNHSFEPESDMLQHQPSAERQQAIEGNVAAQQATSTNLPQNIEMDTYGSNMEVPYSQNPFHPPVPESIPIHPNFGVGLDFSGGLDQYSIEWDPAWDDLCQTPPSFPLNDRSGSMSAQIENTGPVIPAFNFGAQS